MIRPSHLKKKCSPRLSKHVHTCSTIKTHIWMLDCSHLSTHAYRVASESGVCRSRQSRRRLEINTACHHHTMHDNNILSHKMVSLSSLNLYQIGRLRASYFNKSTSLIMKVISYLFLLWVLVNLTVTVRVKIYPAFVDPKNSFLPASSTLCAIMAVRLDTIEFSFQNRTFSSTFPFDVHCGIC